MIVVVLDDGAGPHHLRAARHRGFAFAARTRRLLNVHRDHTRRAELPRSRARVHPHIARADHDDRFTRRADNRLARVRAREKFQRGNGALVAGEGHRARLVRAGCDDDAIVQIANLLEKFRRDFGAEAHLDAERENAINLSLDQVLLKPILRDRLRHFAAEDIALFVNCDSVSAQRELPRRRKSADARTNHGEAFACVRRHWWRGQVHRKFAERSSQHREINVLTGACDHARIRTHRAAHRSGEWIELQNQVERLAQFAFTQKIDAILGRDVTGARVFARRGKDGIVPHRRVRAIFAERDERNHRARVLHDIAEQSALNPTIRAKLAERLAFADLLDFVVALGDDFAPFDLHEHRVEQIGTFDGFEKLGHARRKKIPVFFFQCLDEFHVARQFANRTAHVNRTANHADARAVADDGREFVGIVPAHNRDAATHKLEWE